MSISIISHSALEQMSFKLIVVADPSKPVEFTAKGTPRRQFTLDAYQYEIDEAYKAFEESSQHSICAPSIWEPVAVLLFIREVVNNALGFEAQDHADLFRVGADRSVALQVVSFLISLRPPICASLTATYIRNTITRALRDSKVIPLTAIRALPDDFVYDHPSIATLSDFVYDIPRHFQGYFEGGDETAEDSEGLFQWPKLAQEGETVLQVRKGRGEPPLMVIHGMTTVCS
jgi:hypothetical protein